jgi:primosomal protein N' (replication factor Y)
MRDTRLIGFARDNRQSPTDAEHLLWYHLRYKSLGVKFRRQHPIGPYIADFACLSRRLVIEIDGSQHRDSSYDRQRDLFMRDQGWIVLRFWAWEVVRNIEGVLNGIVDAIEEQHPPRPT